jgi:putative membrane protein insertion efficiency factor
MHGLFPAKRSVAEPPGNHHASPAREGRCPQSPQASIPSNLPIEPGNNSWRVGHRRESPRIRGRSALRETGEGVSASFAQRTADPPRSRSTPMKTVVLTLIRFYQACLSPTLPSACRFYPSCSSYAYEAVEKWGAWHGCRMALGRLLRCRPWGGHGFDPVPSRPARGA